MNTGSASFMSAIVATIDEEDEILNCKDMICSLTSSPLMMKSMLSRSIFSAIIVYAQREYKQWDIEILIRNWGTNLQLGRQVESPE